MEKRISSLALFCLVLSGVGAVDVSIPKLLYEFARGDNITLPCTFRPKNPVGPTDTVIISWFVLNPDAESQEILTFYYPQNKFDIDPMFDGRASPDVDVLQGKANLKLSSLKISDNKTYECHLQILGDKTGKPVGSTRVLVLVAPSTPVCKIQGTAEYGQDITLTCASAEGSPAPTYKWDRRNVQNLPVPQDPKTTDKGGILSLYNITKDTSGFYTCTSANKIRSATCNLTLAVMPPSMKVGSTAGIIAGVAALLILLLIVVICCCCRKKNKDKEEYSMGVHEEYTDKPVDRNVENQRLEGQGNDRGNEDSSVKRTDHYEERSEPEYENRRKDYDDRRSDYDDRRSDYDDRRSDYDDRRSDYDDRRSDYNDRRPRDDDRRPRDYDDRRSDYDDRRSDYNDRRSDYNDRRSRDFDDDRRNDDDRRYEDRRRDDPRDRERPAVPNSKPPRRDYD